MGPNKSENQKSSEGHRVTKGMVGVVAAASSLMAPALAGAEVSHNTQNSSNAESTFVHILEQARAGNNHLTTTIDPIQLKNGNTVHPVVISTIESAIVDGKEEEIRQTYYAYFAQGQSATNNFKDQTAEEVASKATYIKGTEPRQEKGVSVTVSIEPNGLFGIVKFEPTRVEDTPVKGPITGGLEEGFEVGIEFGPNAAN